MKAYFIRNWNELFENSRSRVVKDLAWVAVPNRHDGENYSILMQHERAAEIFSGWVLILQVASKCNPRGSLLKDDGTPHTDRSLSAKCRCPVTWFTLALDYLENHTDWLETKEINDARQDGDGMVTANRQVSAEEGKGKKEGREGNGSPQFEESEIPSWKEFWEYCQSVHCGISAEWFAKDKYWAAGQDKWKGKSDWRAYARRVKVWWENDGRPSNPPKSRSEPPKKPHIVKDSNYDSTKAGK